MTPRQRIRLQAEWWPAACRAQGWKTSDRDLRLRVCAWAVSLANPTQLSLLEAINSDRQPPRKLESTNDLNNTDDVDRVKACLGMLADSVKLTGEVGQPQFGSARRKRDVIRAHLKCLALYHPTPRRLLAQLVSDMFDSRDRGAGQAPLTIRDLTDDVQIYRDKKTRELREGPSQLERLLMRFSKMVNDARNKNELQPAYKQLQGTEPLTIHEMKWTAGVYCDCSYCNGLRARGKAPIIPPLPVEENWSDFDPELEPATAADCELGAGTNEEGVNPF
jgi:hypothetical protein